MIAVSSDVRDELLRSGAREKRVTVILNGIDAERFRRDPTPPRRRATRLGSRPTKSRGRRSAGSEPQKRFDLLFEAFAPAAQRRPELKLFIAGEGGARQAARSRTSSASRLKARRGCSATCGSRGRLPGARSVRAERRLRRDAERGARGHGVRSACRRDRRRRHPRADSSWRGRSDRPHEATRRA